MLGSVACNIMLDGGARICFEWGGKGRTVEMEVHYILTPLSDKAR